MGLMNSLGNKQASGMLGPTMQAAQQARRAQVGPGGAAWAPIPAVLPPDMIEAMGSNAPAQKPWVPSAMNAPGQQMAPYTPNPMQAGIESAMGGGQPAQAGPPWTAGNYQQMPEMQALAQYMQRRQGGGRVK